MNDVPNVIAQPNLPETDADWFALSLEIDNLFSGAPVAEEDLFAGRSTEVVRILEAVLEPSRHIVLFGERGVGKTSIANVFWRRYNAQLKTVVASRVQADPSDTFSSLWNKAFDEFISVAKSAGKYDLVPVSNELSFESPDQVRRELQKCRPNAIPILIFDEFDKLKNAEARMLFANLIKYLYDYSVNVTLILVGVAEDVKMLVADHQSIVRALTEIRLGRMSETEVNDVIDTRLKKTVMTIAPEARDAIVRLSQGLPYFTQMLTKYAAKDAIEKHSVVIGVDHTGAAMARFIRDSDQTFEDDYARATESPQRNHLYNHVLLACALAPKDKGGYFSPSDVIAPLSAVTRKPKQHAHFARHLAELIGDDRGQILTRRGQPRNYRFRFSDPMMQTYVIIRSIRDGLARLKDGEITVPPQE